MIAKKNKKNYHVLDNSNNDTKIIKNIMKIIENKIKR